MSLISLQNTTQMRTDLAGYEQPNRLILNQSFGFIIKFGPYEFFSFFFSFFVIDTIVVKVTLKVTIFLEPFVGGLVR